MTHLIAVVMEWLLHEMLTMQVIFFYGRPTLAIVLVVVYLVGLYSFALHMLKAGRALGRAGTALVASVRTFKSRGGSDGCGRPTPST